MRHLARPAPFASTVPRVLAGAVLGLAVGLVPGAAHASPLIETAGAVGGNAGAQGVVTGPGAASTYFNPAMLAEADDELTVGFALLSEQMGITLDGRTAGADVPLVVGSRNVFSQGQPLPPDVVPTQWLRQGCPAGSGQGQCPAPGLAAHPRQALGSSGQTRTYLTLGFTKRLVQDRLTLGLYAMVPISNLTTAQAFFADERESIFSNSLHPEMYGDRLTALSVVAGGAFHVLPNLSLGASVSIGLANVASSRDYVQSATDYSQLLIANSVSTSVNVSPTLGLRYVPVPWLRLGGVVHAPESFVIDTNIDATLPTGTESTATQRSVFDWMPWAVGVGAEVQVARRGSTTTSLVASAQYAFWSSYRDRMDVSPTSYGNDMTFKDTPSGAVGVRQTFKDVRAFLDLRYVPTPVPKQVGRSSYVDNDRFGVGVGADVLVRLLKLRPGVQLFVDRLIPRHQTKDDSLMVDELPDDATVGTTGAAVPGAQGLQTNSPGWPGFASGGWLWGGAVTLGIPL
jgi:long-chain fatty acid transport protein